MMIFTVGANTSVSNTSVIIGSGGGNISCTATGVPIPTITWDWNDTNQSSTPLMQYDVITENSLEMDGNDTIIIKGNIVSTLFIVNPIYPDDEWNYVCTATSDHSNSSIVIRVQILGNMYIHEEPQ